MIVSGTLALEEGTTVLGNVRSIESTVTQAEGADVAGDIKGVDAELIALGAFLGPGVLLFAIGLLLASLVAGLLLVGHRHPPAARGRTGDRHRTPEGLRDRPVRRDRHPDPGHRGHRDHRRRPARARDPARLRCRCSRSSGSSSAGIFLGEELLGTRKEPAAARPYRGALLGIVLLQVIGLVPFVGGLATAVASILGLGAILLLGWRTVRGTGAGQTATPMSAPAPIGA